MPQQLAITYYQLAFQVWKIELIFSIHLYNDTWKIQGSLKSFFFSYKAMKVIDIRLPADGLDHDYTA